jgi:hypothetical protein
MEWSIKVPLLGNRVIMTQMVWWAGLTALICGAIFGAIMIGDDGMDAVPTMLLIMGAIFVGLIVFTVLVMLVFFFNRMKLRFRIDERGVAMATGDGKVRAASTAAVVLGALAGRPGVAGAGLLARGQERDSIAWPDVKRWRTIPDLHAIAAHRGFPSALYIYAPPELFAAVVDRFAAAAPDRRA